METPQENYDPKFLLNGHLLRGVRHQLAVNIRNVE